MHTPKSRFPLWMRIVTAALVGAVLGVVAGDRPYLFGYGNEELGQLAMLVIRAIKMLAVPLVLFAILDAFTRTTFEAKSFGKLALICLMNVTVAFAIGLTLMNVLKPGQGAALELAAPHADSAPKQVAATLDPVKNVQGYVPESVVKPFLENNVIGVVLLAVLAGAAFRRVKAQQEATGETSARVVSDFIEVGYRTLLWMLGWVIQVVPFAVFGAVAHSVGRYGLGIFSSLAVFVCVIALGLGLHALGYYPLVAWLWGGRTPRQFLGAGSEAILTGVSLNSSLATVPVTLRCLDKLGVSPASSRLAACVGTNLNNDGITLYEAMAALFLTQAFGLDLSVGQQALVMLGALMAGVGVAGVPEAGLVVLPLVLSAAGLSEAQIALALPLVLPVDWVLARCRSGVNVMSDMLVALLLDRAWPPGRRKAAAGESEGAA
jgi:DAACS family dicarboxylate/amino acid:cation (Na+ or H+) symporter